MNQPQYTSYNLFKMTKAYWSLSPEDKRLVSRDFFSDMEKASDQTHYYQVYPSRSEYDIMLWHNIKADNTESINVYAAKCMLVVNKYREFFEPSLIFSGITKPSLYSRSTKSKQEIDGFIAERKPYFVIYPFSKTPDWYMLSREERQVKMNEHIKLGRSFPKISQLLLYSFGIQDQEFVVAYEMDDLHMFSDLVQQLRSTEARIYTLLDTPIITCFNRSIDEMLQLTSSSYAYENA